jgi:hypothetical protein
MSRQDHQLTEHERQFTVIGSIEREGDLVRVSLFSLHHAAVESRELRVPLPECLE